MAPLGLAVAGPLADAYGVQLCFVLGGIATVAMGIGGLFVPTLMQIESRGAGSGIESSGQGQAP